MLILFTILSWMLSHFTTISQSSLKQLHHHTLLALLSLGRESITSGIQDPWVVVGTLHTGEQTNGLSWQFSGGQGTCVGQRTVWLSFDVTLLFPFLEVSQ
uniref:Secreted protein n=1 Tax=Cacopsylla melanoneura TaxID=428564 RepID=A0A8D8RI84_9HEMI